MTDTKLPPEADKFLNKIGDRTAVIGIIGMGYVGLPLALGFAEKQFKVIGFDVDPGKIKALAEGRAYLTHIQASRIASARGQLEGTTDFGRLGEPDAVIICVPTPLTLQQEPDMSYIIKTAEAIIPRMRKGQLIILESTTYPGTTDGLLKNMLDKTGLKFGSDYFLAFSPEREDPGNPDYCTTTIPKVVGGVDSVSGDLAVALYDTIMKQTVRVSSASAAEAVKLTENIFRAVNIAQVNELKMIYDKMGIDIWEVLDAAESKPFGFMRFNPGPGWGGHCIPLDPFYLSWKAKEFGEPARFIELAGQINVAMPHYVIGKLQYALNSQSKSVKGSSVLLLGLAYKKDIGDTRESPSTEIMQILEKLGAKISFHDPFVPEIGAMRHAPEMKGMKCTPLTADTVRSFDAVLIITDHTKVDYALVSEHARILVDTRGITRKLKLKPKGLLVQA